MRNCFADPEWVILGQDSNRKADKGQGRGLLPDLIDAILEHQENEFVSSTSSQESHIL